MKNESFYRVSSTTAQAILTSKLEWFVFRLNAISDFVSETLKPSDFVCLPVTQSFSVSAQTDSQFEVKDAWIVRRLPIVWVTWRLSISVDF